MSVPPFIRDSPDELRTGTNVCVFPALWQDGLAARPAVVTVDVRTPVEGLISPFLRVNVWTGTLLCHSRHKGWELVRPASALVFEAVPDLVGFLP
jgi:hypothetical protein